MDVLVAWVGAADLAAAEGQPEAGLGPVASALEAREFGEVHLLADWPPERIDTYLRWLRGRTGARLHLHPVKLPSPTDFEAVWREARKVLLQVEEEEGERRLVFHLSPGTPAMAATWILLAKTRFPAELIESSREHGVRTVSVPFEISAEFLPDLLHRRDRELGDLAAGVPAPGEAFARIVHRGRTMRELLARAARAAARSVPVLVLGESGTGKELLARAIHEASPRAGGPFVPINCGAIPGGLVESTLFGHVRGAFTGANADRPGAFEEASGGTLFLDEIGELPLPAQVKLLRVLQEGRVQRVGETRERLVDVRIVAATNRDLLAEMRGGRFRADLFWRLAVAILRLPPLRERREDIPLLVDHIMERLQEELRDQPGFRPRKLSAAARDLLVRHPWPGNVRELENTLLRALTWSEGETISTREIRAALLPVEVRDEAVLGRPLGDGFDLRELLAEVARHYLSRALDEAGGNLTRAARLVGLPSYQTLSNWLKKYGVERNRRQ